jgi:shikimate kinase
MNPGRPAQIYLVGFMGCGKSTVGPLLARALGRPFIDLDKVIQGSTGRTIPEIFSEAGEAGFREIETRCLEQVAGGPPAVVALGGGAYQDAVNRSITAATGTTIWLQVSLATVKARVLGDPARPLAGDPRRLERLFQARLDAYRQADLQVCAEGRTPEEVVEELKALLTSRLGPQPGP